MGTKLLGLFKRSIGYETLSTTQQQQQQEAILDIESLLLQNLAALSTNQNFTSCLCGWCAASQYDWLNSNWVIGDSLRITLITQMWFIHITDSDTLAIEVQTPQRKLEFDSNDFILLKNRLFLSVIEFCDVLGLEVETTPRDVILAIVITVAETSEDIHFWFNHKSAFADKILQKCVIFATVNYQVLNRISGYKQTMRLGNGPASYLAKQQQLREDSLRLRQLDCA